MGAFVYKVISICHYTSFFFFKSLLGADVFSSSPFLSKILAIQDIALKFFFLEIGHSRG